MIKLVYCITRRPDLSLAEFSTYWHDVHGPIGRRIPGLGRLVQSHPLVAEPGRVLAQPDRLPTRTRDSQGLPRPEPVPFSQSND